MIKEVEIQKKESMSTRLKGNKTFWLYRKKGVLKNQKETILMNNCYPTKIEYKITQHTK